MTFRKDINGLRAIAVIAVVLFHFNPTWLPGGFAGVDVFFVISGFLMTGIIFRGIEQDNFSILKFYVARANRIIPALAALCLVLLIFGWFYLTPLDFKALGKHAASSVTFISNIIYWRESGYFNAASLEKWLLHTWSLSVEWQFYIIYPLVLLLIKKLLSKKIIKPFILVGMILSFVLCIIVTYKWNSPAYYLLPTRAWEMMLGGVAYLYPITANKRQKKTLEIIGLSSIIGSYFLVSANTPWPGYIALFPVLGSFLIIQAQRSDSIITGNFLFEKIGLWSYSIYLWHWPLVVAINYYSLSNIFIYFGLALSILLGFLSYNYIEKIKFKNNILKINDLLKIKPIAIALSITLLSMYIYKTDNISSYHSDYLIQVDKETVNENPRKNQCHVSSGKVPECIYGEGELGAIVIGDSHAQTIVRSVEKSLPENRSVMDWTMSACKTINKIYTVNNNGAEDHSCGNFISYALDEIKKYPDIPIVIHNRYNTILWGYNESNFDSKMQPISYFTPKINGIIQRNEEYQEKINEEFIETICKFSKKNPVFILEQTPELKSNVPKTMARQYLKSNEKIRIKIPLNEYIERNEIFSQVITKLKKSCDITYITTKDIFCNDEFCYGDEYGRPLYFDDDHLSEFGASKLIPKFKKLYYQKHRNYNSPTI